MFEKVKILHFIWCSPLSSFHLIYYTFQYNYDDPQKAGGGGEYEVQVGFGWTNGMLLDLMSSMDCF